MLGVSRQAIQQQINELERDELVTQIPDPTDRRANRIVFSEKGSELINAALATLRQSEQALAMRLGYETVSSLRRGADDGLGSGNRRTPSTRPQALSLQRLSEVVRLSHVAVAAASCG